MGMYTTLRFSAKLSTLGNSIIEKMFTEWDRMGSEEPPIAPVYSRHRRVWDHVIEDIMVLAAGNGGDDNEVYAFSIQCPRRDNIPFMSNGSSKYRNDLKNGTWDVCCMTKNWDDEVSMFLTRILPWLLAEPCVAYSQYEEDRNETKWVIEPKIRLPIPQITQHRLERQ